MHHRKRVYGAGGSEEAGRVIEPRNAYSRGHKDTLRRIEGNADGLHAPEGCMGALWPVRRTPPGSESEAYLHRGNAGTWESHRSPCLQTRIGGPGDQRPWRGRRASTRPRAQQGQHERAEASKVSGSERRAKRPEMGRAAVLAKHSTGEGGEPSPTGPTRGKATPGITFCWTERREIP